MQSLIVARVGCAVTRQRNRTYQHRRYEYLRAAAQLTHYYTVLGLDPSASILEIRRAYRELSKRYHPDTTELPLSVATPKFQQLNEAYATLSNPERRAVYDERIRRVRVPRATELERSENSPSPVSDSTYLDPTDRPLSTGEVFILFMMGLTIVGCLVLAISIALLRGDPL
ncbi:MAG: J domain-containing protein [Cyanobacteriota bacterium]|nr:J domain-containing protein [Cyanobacteriota bacterium]